MKGYQFASSGHASSYLSSSVVRYKEKPIYVIGANNRELRVVHVPCNEGFVEDSSFLIELNSSDVDLSPVPLGYTHIGNNKTVVRCMRVPYRQWKIGLCLSNIALVDIKGQTLRAPERFFFSQELYNTIMGIYPGWKRARAAMRARKFTGGAVAFSRRFAMTKKYLYDYFSYEPCGTIERGRVKLKEDKMFLLEMLLKEGVPCLS